MRDEWDASPAPEQMFVREDLVLDEVRDTEDAIDPLHFLEAFDARTNRENPILLSGFYEQRSRSNQTRDVVHLGPVQNPGNIVVDAVSETSDTVLEGVQVAAHQCHANARIEGSCEHG